MFHTDVGKTPTEGGSGAGYDPNCPQALPRPPRQLHELFGGTRGRVGHGAVLLHDEDEGGMCDVARLLVPDSSHVPRVQGGC